MASPVSIPWVAYLTLMQNFWMVKLGWYGPAAMAITWSLAVEERFYLTIPVLIRKLGRAPLIVALLCIVACAPTLRLILRYFLAHGDFACYVLMPCRADALCLGVLCALLVRDPAGWRFLVGKRSLLYCATGTLFVGIAYMTYRGYEQFSFPMTIYGYSCLAFSYAGCLLIAVSSPAGPWQKLFCTRGLRSLGSVAYCTYLLHFPLINFGRRLLAPYHSAAISYLLGGLIGVAASLMIAALSWKVLEKPMIRRGHKYSY